MPDDFRSTDLQGAAYYARMYDTGYDPYDQPSAGEAENDATADRLELQMRQISDRCRIG